MSIKFGDKIREQRIVKGFSQAQLADLVGVTPSAVSSYETSERQPSCAVLIKIATRLNVSTDYLLGLNKQEVVNISGLSERQKAVIRETVSTFRDDSH